MSYATIAQLQDRYDARLIAQLSNDLNSTGVVTSRVQAALDDASADLLRACLKGSIYASTDLDTLVASGDTSLVRLVSDGAMRNLARRRGMARHEGLEAAFERWDKALRDLSNGLAILNVQTNREADTPSLVVLSCLEQQNLNVLTNTSFFNSSGTRTTQGDGSNPNSN